MEGIREERKEGVHDEVVKKQIVRNTRQERASLLRVFKQNYHTHTFVIK